MRYHAHTLSDFLVPTLSIECEPCGRRGRYNVARLIEKYGDAKLPSCDNSGFEPDLAHSSDFSAPSVG
jgi:hypothetical protein